MDFIPLSPDIAIAVGAGDGVVARDYGQFPALPRLVVSHVRNDSY